MAGKDVTIKPTKHSKIKISQRNIALDDIRNLVLNPEFSETDRFDKSMSYINWREYMKCQDSRLDPSSLLSIYPF